MPNHNPQEVFDPDWAVPPGATIAAILSDRALPREGFADALGENVEMVQRLLLGLETIDRKLANRISKCLGTPESFWIAREAQYRKSTEHIQEQKRVIASELWLKELPAREMAKLGWIGDFHSPAEAAEECLRFFGVPDLSTWQTQYGNATSSVAFRISSAVKTNPGAVTAWLRWAELVAERTPCNEWDPDGFQKRLETMRRLTWSKDPAVFLPKLRQLCAEVGVAVVVARTPKGCPASGATRFLSPTKALIVLSFRYRSDEHFWFTFFHEAGHLILHGPDALFLEDGGDSTSQEEKEANEFAAAILIPEDYKRTLRSLYPGKDAIIKFARQIGIAPGLVVGQLQYLKIVPQDRLNSLKRRYDWEQIRADRIIP